MTDFSFNISRKYLHIVFVILLILLVTTGDLSGQDEFLPLNDTVSVDSLSKGEFSEFASLDDGINTDIRFLIELGVLFLTLILISLFIKNQSVRRLRPFILAITLIYMGFYKGGCPCMIMSMDNTFFLLLGKSVAWISVVWFISLLPLTYFFGKIWCGWLCHLGALQEFLFKGSKLNILKSLRSQIILRRIRIALFIAFLAQSALTMSYKWGHYDPFKVAFNLFAINYIGYILLALLILSSIFIYRPFCRAACPVGLVLGWVSMLPGAKKIGRNDSCINCKSCSKECESNAIVHENSKTTFNTQDCIFCGECMGSCKKGALEIKTLKI